MTVSTQVSRNEYTGNGATTQYDFTFRILDKSHLLVQTLDTSESIVTLTLGTDYTVTGVNRYNGGKVVLTSALPAGYKISIERSTPVTQEASIRNQGGFFPEIHEDALDKLTMLVQQAYGWWSGLSLRKPSWLANYYDALNNRIRNLRDPSQAQDAATKNYVDVQIVDNTNAWKAGDAILDQKIDTNFNKSLRVPEATVGQVPPVAQRSSSILGFNSEGNPVPIFSWTATADLAIKLASSIGASLVGFKNKYIDLLKAKASTVESKLSRSIDLLDYIPSEYHDGIINSTEKNDMTVYFQAAIDDIYAMGGGTIHLPPGTVYANVVAKNFVTIVGVRGSTTRRSVPLNTTYITKTKSSTIKNYDSSKWVIDVADPALAVSNPNAVQVTGFGIVGVDIYSKADNTIDIISSQGGIRLRGPENVIKCSSAYGFSLQGVDVVGNICTVEDVLAVNCCMDRTLTNLRGTIQLGGADGQFHRLEGNAGITVTQASPNMSICGIYIYGNNHYISGLMGEISEIGCYINSENALSKISDSRADNNISHGFVLNGVMGVNLHSYNNSRAGNGLYDGYYLPTGASRIFLVNAYALADNNAVDGLGYKAHRYGLNIVNADYLSLRLKPWITQCFSYGHLSGWINSPTLYGEQYTPTTGRLKIDSNATTTPTVDGISIISITTDTLSQITGFAGGMIGQVVDIYLNATATVTLINSASFLVNNFAKNANKLMEVGRVYRFIKTDNGIWREIGDVVRVYSGPTTSRPSTTAVAGMQYFDTTLNKPIWRNATNSGWVDATGASV